MTQSTWWGGIAPVTCHTTEGGADGIVVVAISKGGICHAPRDFYRIDTRAEGLADVRCYLHDEVVVSDVGGWSGTFSACVVEDFDAQTLKV